VNLNVYEGVQSTLAELRRQNIDVAYFSNSPSSAVLPRLAVHGLDQYASKIMALHNVAGPRPGELSAELYADGAKRVEAQLKSSGAEKLLDLPRELRKPDPQALNDVIYAKGLRPKEVVMVGDNIRDDMGLAQNAGARGLWARYSEFDKVYDETTGGALRNAPIEGPVPKFEGELHKFADLLDKLRPERDLSGLGKQMIGVPKWYLPVQSYGLLGHDK
jgi:phosphoglycolate phosphatase-like HAD superfamily hydrolase